MQVTPSANFGHADKHRQERLLNLAGLLARSDGGTIQLRWPDQADVLAHDGRRDLTFSGQVGGMVTLGQQIRQHSAIARSGASFVTLPVMQDSSLPSIDRSAKATWGGNAANVAPTLDLTSSTPKRLGAYLTVSKQLLKTSPILAAGFLEAQLLSAIGAGIDDAAINGDGSGDPATPVGLLADTGLLEHEFTTSITVADLIEMERLVSANHGEHDPASLAWLADSGTRASLRALPRLTGGSVPAWPDSGTTGPLGHRATVSPFAPASTLVFGSFGDLLVLQSGEVEIQSNPYSQDTEGFLRMLISGWFDVVAINPGHSFVRAVPAV